MKVWITRPAAEAQLWVRDLRALGFDAQALPLIEILPAPQPEAVAAEWRRLAIFRAVMFVSGNAVRGFQAARPAAHSWPQGTRAWATGAGTRQALVDAGIPPASIDSPPADSLQFDSEALWQQVLGQAGAGDKVLIVRGSEAGSLQETGRDWLGDRLRECGVDVTTVVSYMRARPVAAAHRLDEFTGEPGIWLFSSSEAIANLRELAPDASFSASTCVATHPRIAKAAQRAGFGVVRESRPGLDAVAATLESIR